MATLVSAQLFLPYVLPYAPGCDEPTAEFHIRMAAIEFCERTRCWRQLVEVVVNDENETVAAPALTAIHEFERATWEGQDLTPIEYTATDPEGLTDVLNEGTPSYITQTEPGMVAIYPFAEGTLRLSVFLKPRHGQSATPDPADPLHDALNVVPDFLLSRHAETISHGALARILSVPAQPWTDPAEAARRRDAFETGIGSMQSQSLRGQQRAPVRTKTLWM